MRAALGDKLMTRLAEYLESNNYPGNIRSTLRDALTYLYVELLANTSLWRPGEAAELYRIDLQALITGESVTARGPERPLDPSVHPLVKVGSILDDLETWHAENRRFEAALEARLERLRRLHSPFKGPSDRDLIIADLQNRLSSFKDSPGGRWARPPKPSSFARLTPTESG